jgi:LmbE family N-acetylglucosaminyl deacetylase
LSSIAGGLIFSMVNAAVEEGAYRGVLMHGLDSALGRGPAALVLQALAFRALHVQGFPRGALGVGLASIFGLLMGIIRRRADGMLAPWLHRYRHRGHHSCHRAAQQGAAPDGRVVTGRPRVRPTFSPQEEAMKRTWTIIGVADVARSFKWYQSLFGQPETQPEQPTLVRSSIRMEPSCSASTNGARTSIRRW